MTDTALHWFRRDLRLNDNAALAAALAENERVYCVFVFDTEILDALSRRADRRVEFIWHSIEELNRELIERGGSLIVLHGRARGEIPLLAERLGVDAVYANRDYEPIARARDASVEATLGEAGIAFEACKDQVIFERDEVMSQQGRPFTVFSAYRRAWLKQLSGVSLEPALTDGKRGKFAAAPFDSELPSLQTLGFETTNLLSLGFRPGASGGARTFAAFRPRMRYYKTERNFPGRRGVSYLSVHLRFGTVSIRELARAALEQSSDGAETWLSELIWRDFYFSILYQFPHVVGHAFKPEFDALEFTNRRDHFDAWCEGRTGYPIVDAAMRQLNHSGYMHNRLRMVTASFLVKDLHVDWRWGERYFADNLNDFDLAANNGGWQWAASTGNDAQPWFRIFNPTLQSQKFDPDGRFIRRYVPELSACSDKSIHEPGKMSEAEQSTSRVKIGSDYPQPIVDHAVARKGALEMFEKAKSGGE
ncbi:MAG: deoxyribodipyrimidine photo-lyase [Gemmatimonadaceae bacterium]